MHILHRYTEVSYRDLVTRTLLYKLTILPIEDQIMQTCDHLKRESKQLDKKNRLAIF